MLEKIIEFQLALGTNFACLGQVLCSCKVLVAGRVERLLAQQASEDGMLFAWKENLLVPDDRMTLFSSPVHTSCIYDPVSLMWPFLPTYLCLINLNLIY